MSVIVVIPARLDSTRFPGKMLADRTGHPLVEHVHDRAAAASCVDRVVVATPDQKIIDAVGAFGGEAVRTRADHPNGTSRIAEAAANLDARIIVNVQGDEPELEPATIDATVAALEADPDCPMATAAAPFEPRDDPAASDLVKVVLDERGRALYFSRALVPLDRDGTGLLRPLRHVGIYVYRRPFLSTYAALSPTALEQCEQLEQLRVLGHGYPIAVAQVAPGQQGIDTPEQYAAFVDRFHAAASG